MYIHSPCLEISFNKKLDKSSIFHFIIVKYGKYSANLLLWGIFKALGCSCVLLMAFLKRYHYIQIWFPLHIHKKGWKIFVYSAPRSDNTEMGLSDRFWLEWDVSWRQLRNVIEILSNLRRFRSMLWFLLKIIFALFFISLRILYWWQLMFVNIVKHKILLLARFSSVNFLDIASNRRPENNTFNNFHKKGNKSCMMKNPAQKVFYSCRDVRQDI